MDFLGYAAANLRLGMVAEAVDEPSDLLQVLLSYVVEDAIAGVFAGQRMGPAPAAAGIVLKVVAGRYGRVYVMLDCVHGSNV